MKEYSYIGKGKVFLSSHNDYALRFVGNCDKVELSFSEETKENKDFTQAGGGISNSVSRIEKVEIGLNLFDYSPDNLALSVFGENYHCLSGNVVGEKFHLYRNRLIRLQHSHIHDVVVRDVRSDKIYQPGIDYEVLASGIFISENSTIEEGTQATIDYQHRATNVIQALVNSGQEYRFLFDGLNEAQSGKKVVLDVFRVKFTPAASLSFIGEDFGNIEIKGTALSDFTKTGQGISRFFTVEMEQ